MRLEEAEQILGLSRPYDEDSVAKAFRAKAKEHHPDRGGDASLFVRTSEARGVVLEALLDLSPDLAPGLDEELPEGFDEDWFSDLPGPKISVLYVEIDGRPHPAPGRFRARTVAVGRQREVSSLRLESPAPIRRADRVSCLLVFDGDEVGDAIRFDGKVTERVYDVDHMVVSFRIDAFQG